MRRGLILVTVALLLPIATAASALAQTPKGTSTAPPPPPPGSGRYFRVDYPASTDPKELQTPVTYTLWIPENVARLRGVIVHQHGAGTTAAKEGSTAAYDLHWQALAKKWDSALLVEDRKSTR